MRKLDAENCCVAITPDAITTLIVVYDEIKWQLTGNISKQRFSAIFFFFHDPQCFITVPPSPSWHREDESDVPKPSILRTEPTPQGSRFLLLASGEDDV